MKLIMILFFLGTLVYTDFTDFHRFLFCIEVKIEIVIKIVIEIEKFNHKFRKFSQIIFIRILSRNCYCCFFLNTDL